jgi:ABC-type branched-subunit amino acid transport system ATPase component
MLEASGISVSFGGVRAVQQVSLTVDAREIVGLIGPNGSGKTTFLNALTGVTPATGALRFDGRSLRLGHPERIRRAGMLRMFQTPQTFTELSCIENVLLSSPDHRATGLAGSWLVRPWMWSTEKPRWAAALTALERVGLADRAEAPASVLTFGEQRLLELARGMAGRPSLLMLDEPSAGLNDAETRNLAELITEVRDSGVAVLVVDHKIDFIDGLCDRIVVLELGSVIVEGTPADVWRDQRVVDAYLGVARGA